MQKDTIEQARAYQRARRCWELMDKNERTAVRIGMAPLWCVKEDLDGKAKGEGWEDIINHGEAGKLLSLALFGIAKRNGGMIS